MSGEEAELVSTVAKGAGGSAGVIALVGLLLRWIPGTVTRTKNDVVAIKTTLHGDEKNPGEGLVGRVGRLERLHDEDETPVRLARLEASLGSLHEKIDRLQPRGTA